MGRFLNLFYEGNNVAAVDIGAINYLADIKCLDLIGLGSLDVAKKKREHTMSVEKVYALAKARGVKIAVVYGNGPLQWTKVGVWKISDNYICFMDSVTFYVVDPLEKEKLIASLKEFSPMLPSSVKQSGEYTE